MPNHRTPDEDTCTPTPAQIGFEEHGPSGVDPNTATWEDVGVGPDVEAVAYDPTQPTVEYGGPRIADEPPLFTATVNGDEFDDTVPEDSYPELTLPDIEPVPAQELDLVPFNDRDPFALTDQEEAAVVLGRIKVIETELLEFELQRWEYQTLGETINPDIDRNIGIRKFLLARYTKTYRATYGG